MEATQLRVEKKQSTGYWILFGSFKMKTECIHVFKQQQKKGPNLHSNESMTTKDEQEGIW